MTEEREKRIREVLHKRQQNLTVVLENVFDPHNISAVLRSCDAVGVSEVFVLNTKIPKHKKFGKSSSSSALKWVKVHQFTDAHTCFHAVRQRYKHVLATHLSADAVSLYALDLTQPVALVFGNEAEGVSDDMLAYCDGNFHIPQVGMIRSLNISVACAVSLYEAYRQKALQGHYTECTLSRDAQHDLLNYWDVTLPG